MKHSAADAGTPSTQTSAGTRGASMCVLLEAARGIQERLETALESVGLSSAKYLALDALVQAGEPLTLSDLAARLKCVRSNITQLVDRLETDGLVKRGSDPSDRRALRAVVTKRGVTKHAAGTDAMRRLEADLAALVDPGDRALLHRVLSALG